MLKMDKGSHYGDIIIHKGEIRLCLHHSLVIRCAIADVVTLTDNFIDSQCLEKEMPQDNMCMYT